MARLDVKTFVARGEDAAVFFELETTAPAAAITLVAEWHEIRDGKDRPRPICIRWQPFEAMFTGR